MTPVEQVARALCLEVGNIAYDDLPASATYMERKTHGDRAILDQCEACDVARAAIRAIRDPTIHQLIAGARAMRVGDLDVTEKEFELGWKAAIDRALEE